VRRSLAALSVHIILARQTHVSLQHASLVTAGPCAPIPAADLTPGQLPSSPLSPVYPYPLGSMDTGPDSQDSKCDPAYCLYTLTQLFQTVEHSTCPNTAAGTLPALVPWCTLLQIADQNHLEIPLSTGFAHLCSCSQIFPAQMRYLPLTNVESFFSCNGSRCQPDRTELQWSRAPAWVPSANFWITMRIHIAFT
jgi:hypothetical protein